MTGMRIVNHIRPFVGRRIQDNTASMIHNRSLRTSVLYQNNGKYDYLLCESLCVGEDGDVRGTRGSRLAFNGII